jgi:hypothetical protein
MLDEGQPRHDPAGTPSHTSPAAGPSRERDPLVAGNARSYMRWGEIKVVGALEREEMAHGSGSQSTVDDENLTQFL